MFPKAQPIRSKALRDSARGEDCTLRLPGHCNHNPETVVLCHLRDLGDGGMGTKPDDVCAIYACSGCHDAVDGRVKSDLTPNEIAREEGRAHCETLVRMVRKGVITVKGAK